MVAFDADFPAALPAKTPLLGGSYILEGVIGQGGAGITYLATDTGLRRAVAIKEFFPTDSQRVGMEVAPGGSLSRGEYDLAREEFMEETRTLARFQHPGIVDVYTVFAENNTAYMVMEYLRGLDLAQIVEERGPLAETDALNYIRQIGAALEVVHREAMLHRDVKPDNVVVRDDGSAVLIDFGLTQKLQTPKGLGTTRLSSNTRFGTAGYAPLEQYSRQAQVGVFTDVYALAATLYHLLTGQAPTEATDRAAGADLPDPRQINPQLSGSTVQALSQALAMDARQRPQSVRAFLDMLNSTPATEPEPFPAQPPRPISRPEYDEPAAIDLPGYSPQPVPQRIPAPPRHPEPDTESYPNYYTEPPNYTPTQVILPGFGCVRGGGCVVGCVIFILLIALQFIAAIFSFLFS